MANGSLLNIVYKSQSEFGNSSRLIALIVTSLKNSVEVILQCVCVNDGRACW